MLPFHNEAAAIASTIESLADQHEACCLVLVDNGSTDNSVRIARAVCERRGIAISLINEPTPGKVAALAAGLAAVSTPYVATCDADTWYPPDYLSHAATLLKSGADAAGAYYAAKDSGRGARAMAALRWLAPATLLPWQCHVGGAGQVFRTDRLRAAGGFNPERWNLVLEDHEIIWRINRAGITRYGMRFWCAPSPRPRNRKSARWSLGERLLYHATPRAFGDRYFYGFLKPRLSRRVLTSDSLRVRAPVGECAA